MKVRLTAYMHPPPLVRLAAASVAAFLFGCAQTDAPQTQAVDTIAGVSDRAREDAELVLCRGITVGAWVRAYGNDTERAEAWRKLCSAQVKATP